MTNRQRVNCNILWVSHFETQIDRSSGEELGIPRGGKTFFFLEYKCFVCVLLTSCVHLSSCCTETIKALLHHSNGLPNRKYAFSSLFHFSNNIFRIEMFEHPTKKKQMCATSGYKNHCGNSLILSLTGKLLIVQCPQNAWHWHWHMYHNV